MDEGRPRLAALMTAAVAALAADGLAAYLLWRPVSGPWVLPVGVGLHGLAAVALGALLWLAGRVRVMAPLISALALVLPPPAGALAGAAVALWAALRRPVGRPLATDLAESPGEAPRAGRRLLAAGQTAGPALLTRAIEVQPLVDILRSEDLQLKASAIDVMTRLGSGQVVSVLKSLLTAPEADVRFQAAVALSKLEAQISQAINEARQRTRREPDSAQAALLLGRLYLDYAMSGLLDPTTSAHYARLAAQEFRRAWELDPDAPARLELARAHLVAGEYREVLAVLESETLRPQEAGEASMLRMEALFSLGRFDQLRQETTQALERRAVADPDRLELLRWWAGEAP